jgi:ketosteroid isomerase-like protein
MRASRRSLLTAAGAALASSQAAAAGSRPDIDQAVAELQQRSVTANAALLRGDVKTYRALVTLTDDFTLMSPFGGAPTHGRDMSEDRWAAMERFFRNGTLTQEVVASYGTAEMVVLVVIERAHGEVGSLPAQDWPLRVTLVYRRDQNEWRLAHRHADPLAPGISLALAAELARGARS